MQNLHKTIGERVLGGPLERRYPDLSTLLEGLGINVDKEMQEGWREIEQRWPQFPVEKLAARLEPKFDLLTGEIKDFEEIIDKPDAVPEEENVFLTTPPGFDRGVHFDVPLAELAGPSEFVSLANIIGQPATKPPPIENRDISEPQAIDELLPADDPSEILSTRPKSRRFLHLAGGSWARAVNINHIPSDYGSVVAELAFPFPFELDPFQKQAIYHLEKGDSVFVAAHTSAGKTAVADYAVALAKKHMTKAIYTSPIKALSNQKFRDFRNTFDEDVGLLTGDIRINPDASCLIMTTEILRSMLYKNADVINDVEFVIFDEVHYVNDIDRGVVWEEVIIMLPPQMTLIMLSATIPNTMEFADWVGRTKRKEIFVISTLKRPVPLEHFLYMDRQLVGIVDQERRFLEAGYREALTLQKSPSSKAVLAPKHVPVNRGIKQERSLWTDVVYLLKKKTLVPAVIFVFSKRKCEENADALANLDLNSAAEKSAIHIFLEMSISKLKTEDRNLPQIIRMREMLARGVAVHHGGLLPILKEAIEILFSRGLVRILFATETFAMGVNMPARTVVFSGLRKHDGNGFRPLLPGEYTQMAGRAGRRGLDATGTVVIVVPEEVPAELTLRSIILGTPTKLVSQFRLTYNMILNLLRVQALKIEEMIKSSFSEHAGQMMLPEDERELQESKALLDSAETLECPICKDIAELYSVCLNIQSHSRVIFEGVLRDFKQSQRLLEPGRIIIVNNSSLRNVPAVVLKLIHSQTGYSISCLVLFNHSTPNSELDPIPFPMTFINSPDVSLPLTQDVLICGANEIVSITANILMKRLADGDLGNIQDEFVKFLSRSPNFVEIDIPAFKAIEIEEKRLTRRELIKDVPLFDCQNCPDLTQHFEVFHRRRLLVERLAELQFRLSDNSLVLLPEYRMRLGLLRELGYVDLSGNVTVKGRVACELNTVHELITTELLFDNAFVDCGPAEIVALLSTMVFQERLEEEPSISGILVEGWERIKNVASRLSMLVVEHGLCGGLVEALRPGLIDVVYHWACGMPFGEIATLTEVLEGSIVRSIVRLDETCRELRSAARIMGDTSLFRKMEEASQLIKRDICSASSLYI